MFVFDDVDVGDKSVKFLSCVEEMYFVLTTD